MPRARAAAYSNPLQITADHNKTTKPELTNQEDNNMKSLILWICGVPITVIILLKVFGVF